MSNFGFPTQYRIKEITIDGEDITGLFMYMEIFENIFIPAVSGMISFMDIDGAGFVEEYEIEFNEPFSFSIEAGTGDEIKFDGVLNGLNNEVTQNGKKIYSADFTTKEMRTNEKTFISHKYEDNPQNVVMDMIEKIEGKLNTTGTAGDPMIFNASRWKPFKVINYALQNGCSGDSSATKKEDGQPTEEKAEGTTGFLCWQTIGEKNEYRFCSVDELLDGAFETHDEYRVQLMNRSIPMDEAKKCIVDYDFNEMGDIQTKMKSGAFHSLNISFDMDTGEYKEYIYDGREGDTMTEKQKEIVDAPTRILFKPFQNDKFAKDCQSAEPDTGDQSRKTLAQNNARQNTFNDQTGHLTLYPNYEIKAGDIIDIKINKVKSADGDGGHNQKHSGKYVIKQVAHFFQTDNKAYTRLTTLRATQEVDRASAQ